MRIKHLKLENFCGFCNGKIVDSDLANTTEVSGCNASGKSTVKRAIFWTFNCRGENGEEITGIRPHDENGNDVNDIEVTAEVCVDIGGTEKTFKKVSRQNYNKKGEFTGNIIDYYINDIPKKKSDYEEFISTELAPVGVLSSLLNAKTLLSKSAADCRAALESVFGTCTDVEVCQLYPEFSELLPLFEDGSVDELKNKYNVILNGRRGKSGTKGLLDLRKEFPSRIDEVTKQKISIDINAANQKIADINDELSANQDMQSDVQRSFDAQRSIQQRIRAIETQIENAVQDLNAESFKRSAELTEKIRSSQHELDLLNSNINSKEHDIHNIDSEIRDLETKRIKLASEWKNTKQMEFDESNLICPYCKREYPSEKQYEMRDHFNESKEQRLKEITDEGMICKVKIEELKKDLEELNTEISNLNQSVASKKKSIAELASKKESIKLKTVDDYTVPEDLQQELSQLKSQLRDTTANETFVQLKSEENSLRSQLSQLQSELSKQDINSKIDARIEELNTERLKNEQAIADVQKIISLLKKFNARKHELLESKVNEYLSFCKVRFFRPLINGDLEEACDFCVDGEPYSRNLNHGARILVEMDLCQAFQKKYNVNLPIIIDDSESVDSWKLPEVDHQLIILKRTDSKELTIKEV